MITAIDTNVLLDVFLPDPEFGPASKFALARQFEKGSLCVCDVVYSELAAFFDSKKAVDEVLLKLGIRFKPIGEEAAFKAGCAWKLHARRSTKRARVLADFLIGAHAECEASALLTRDRGFYRDYFPNLNIISP